MNAIDKDLLMQEIDSDLKVLSNQLNGTAIYGKYELMQQIKSCIESGKYDAKKEYPEIEDEKPEVFDKDVDSLC